MQYKKIITTNKLLVAHLIVFLPGMVYFIYYMKNSLLLKSESYFSMILFFIFIFQSILIVGKRLKNEDFFSSNCFTIFPIKKVNIFFYTLILGNIDLNVILLIFVSVGTILYVTSLSLPVTVVFLLMFLVCEITYLIYMMVTIEIMMQRYRNSKNIFIITVLLFLLIQQFTFLSDKFYLFDFYPISGWISSTTKLALQKDISRVLIYFGVAVFSSIIGLFLLNKISFPRKNNVF